MTQTKEKIETKTEPPLEGWVVLARRPGENHYVGLIEKSWSLDWSSEFVRFWWSGPAYAFGEIYVGEINGREDALRQRDEVAKRRPDWEVFAFDVRDPDLPIEIDWDVYGSAENKFDSRNPPFLMR